MTYKMTHDNVAVVTPAVKWIPISYTTPTSGRMLLIDKAQGIAYIRQREKDDGFTHWSPLPTF